MRSKTTSWFETKVRYDKTMEDGQNKKVTEAYTVEALSFSEAESAITEEISHYISGEFDVKAITRVLMARFSSAMLTATTDGIVQDLHSLPLTKRQRKKNVPTLFTLFRLKVLTRLVNTSKT